MGLITSTIASYYNYYTTRTDDPDAITALTSREKYLVQSSWAPIKKDLTSNGVQLLILLFKMYPEEQKHFPFKDLSMDELRSDKKFHAHCSSVMYAVDSIIDNLNESELLVHILQKIGRNHHRNHVEPISFSHTKEAILKLFGPSMSHETIQAWDKALQVAFGVVSIELEKPH